MPRAHPSPEADGQIVSANNSEIICRNLFPGKKQPAPGNCSRIWAGNRIFPPVTSFLFDPCMVSPKTRFRLGKNVIKKRVLVFLFIRGWDYLEVSGNREEQLCMLRETRIKFLEPSTIFMFSLNSKGDRILMEYL